MGKTMKKGCEKEEKYEMAAKKMPAKKIVKKPVKKAKK